jgi:NADH:quinone reductase (non-electrogenic)
MTIQHAHRVVIVGGGFGGLYAAQRLRRAPVEVTVVDRRNFHLFQPLLYQVATGGLGTGDIASPLRAALKGQRNARVLLGEVRDVDAAARQLRLDGSVIPYDTLIVAAGVKSHYFGHDEWAPVAPSLKSVEDAVEIRSRVLRAFEAAEREPDPERRAAWLTFVIVGAGPTGVELAGALGELAHHTLRGEFQTFDPRDSRILLLDSASAVLSSFPPRLARHARDTLERLGIEVRTDCRVAGIDECGVEVVEHGWSLRLPARTVVWAAGVAGATLGARLAAATGCELDGLGRVKVNPDLSVDGRPEIFVIGDLAHVEHEGAPLPCVAPPAMQEGRYVARLIRARMAGRKTAPFRYFDKGSLATIGRHAAVANFRGLQFWGGLAWLIWLVIHLFYLIEYENRLLVFIQWFNNYVTRHRGSRLITELMRVRAD